METTENEHRKFELNALRYRQPVQFPEQWRYVLVGYTFVWSRSAVQRRLRRAEQTEVAPVNRPLRPASVALP